MAIRRRNNKKRPAKKRMGAKKGRVQRRFTRVPRGVSVLANIPKVYHLRYCDYFGLTSSAGTIGKYVFRANGLHDCNQSGVGHQPYLWDQVKAFFNSYTVVGAKINFSIIGTNGTGSAVGGHAMGVILDNDASTASSYTTIVEAGQGRHRLLSPTLGQGPTSVQGYFSAKKFFNVVNIKDNSALYGAATSADPPSQAFFTCWYQSMTEDSGSSTSVQCRVVIDYTVIMAEPIDQAAS